MVEVPFKLSATFLVGKPTNIYKIFMHSIQHSFFHIKLPFEYCDGIEQVK